MNEGSIFLEWLSESLNILNYSKQNSVPASSELVICILQSADLNEF